MNNQNKPSINDRDFFQLMKNVDDINASVISSVTELLILRLREEFPDEYKQYLILPESERSTFLESMRPQFQRTVDPSFIKEVVDKVCSIMIPNLSDEFAKEIQVLSLKGGFGDLDHTIEKYKMAVVETPISSDKANSIKAMEAYKTIVEGPYRWYVSIICYSMAKAGKEHPYMENEEHQMPNSLYEVYNRDIGALMAFINKYGHTTFTKCNRVLRNAASHERYKVLKDGTIRYWDKRSPAKNISLDELNDEIDSLVDLLYSINEGLRVAVESWLKEIQRECNK